MQTPIVDAEHVAAKVIHLGTGLPVPVFIPPSDNPFSAGRFPLARNFTVGDRYLLRMSDAFTGVVQWERARTVTRVDPDADRVEFGGGIIVSDLMGNTLRNHDVELAEPMQEVPVEIQLGKRWRAVGRRVEKGVASDFFLDFHVARREMVTVPAGTFDAFVIEGEGFNRTFGSRIETRAWVVPGLNVAVKRENIGRNRNNFYFRTERLELVEAFQKGSDTRCLPPAPTSGPASRNLVIRSNCV